MVVDTTGFIVAMVVGIAVMTVTVITIVDGLCCLFFFFFF